MLILARAQEKRKSGNEVWYQYTQLSLEEMKRTACRGSTTLFTVSLSVSVRSANTGMSILDSNGVEDPQTCRTDPISAHTTHPPTIVQHETPTTQASAWLADGIHGNASEDSPDSCSSYQVYHYLILPIISASAVSLLTSIKCVTHSLVLLEARLAT